MRKRRDREDIEICLEEEVMKKYKFNKNKKHTQGNNERETGFVRKRRER